MKRQFALITFLATVASVEAVANANISLFKARLDAIAFDAIPACSLPAGVVSHSDQRDLPQALRDAVKQKLGELVPPGAQFDATDVVMTGHNRRLIFIWVPGNRWVIATEHGGYGYNDPILAYTVNPNESQATLVAERVAFPRSVCSTAEDLLSVQAAPTPIKGK